MKLIVMILFWGIIGWVVACYRAARDPNDPCPKAQIWKCIVAFIFGIIGGLAYYYLMGFKDAFSSVDFIASSIFASALGRFIYLFICPKGRTTT
jgi:uncharacterized membrane protein YeaQ/YmgE (transglycosylase-associated protein family)